VSEYCFARRFSVGDRRNAMAPVHWKGFTAVAIYAVALIIGGLAVAWMGASGHLVQGTLVFAAAAIVGAGWFIVVSQAKGDPNRTPADYRKANPRA
jgi:hypothetical protein